MREPLRRALFVEGHADETDVDECFAEFSDCELVQEAIVNCAFAR